MPSSNEFPDYHDYLHVVAAVIVDQKRRILITRRHDHLHQGGLWEFPGGKVEKGESVDAALSRELDEELGIKVHQARPLIRIPYEYPDRRVLLDVWKVQKFAGEARGMEGQPLCWISPEELLDYSFPAANQPIVTAARLPSFYLITPEPGPITEWPSFLHHIRQLVERGISLIQLRSKLLSNDELLMLVQEAQVLCHKMGASLLVNTSVELIKELPAGVGVHLASTLLQGLHTRPVEKGRWLAASCHNINELRIAQSIDADFAVISPVKMTKSHPGTVPIGWEGLRSLTERSFIPLYALGGLQPEDVGMCWAHGAQGVAAIRGIWEGPDSMSFDLD